MNFINLTPHELNILNDDEEEVLTIPPSGDTVRVDVTRQTVDHVEGAPIKKTEFGDVEGLPEPKEDTIYVVSGFVGSHPDVSDRDDVVSPGQLVRDENGKPIGAKGFAV